MIDFDKALRDPANPAAMRPAYDSGDNLHPNDAGYQAMADAIDLSLFGGPEVRAPRGHCEDSADAVGQAEDDALPVPALMCLLINTGTVP